MLRSIDGKSLVIGGLLVAVAVCAMGVLPAVNMDIGRYSLVAPEGGPAYVIDTTSGQVWQQTTWNRMPNAFYPASLEPDIFRRPTEPNGVDPNAPQP